MAATPATPAAPGATDDGSRALRLLPLRQELRLYPAQRRHDGSPEWTLHDRQRQAFFRIGWAEFTLLSHWRAGLSAEELCAQVNAAGTLQVTVEDVEDLQRFLLQNQLVSVNDPAYTRHLLDRYRSAQHGALKAMLHRYLFFRIPLLKPDRFLDATVHAAELLVTRPMRVALIIALLVGLYLISRQWDSFQQTFLYFFSLQGLALYALTVVLVKIAHELGHAYTAKHYGLNVPTMGVAFLVLWPVLYTDTTDAWKLPSRRARLWITAAGMTTELALAGVATLAWSFLPEGPLKSAAFMIATVSWVMTLLINVNPFMRFDGYYLLSDLLDTPNLGDRSFALGKWWLRRTLFGVDQPLPEHLPLRRQRLLIAYALGTWMYRAVLFIGIAVLVYYLFFKPLGLFLMLVELGVFIGMPVWRELKAWHAMRGELRWNAAMLRTLLVTAGLIGLFVFPWQGTVERAALLRPATYSQIYSPEPARLKALHVSDGQSAAEGELLFELEAPELAAQARQAAIRVQTLQWQVARSRAVASLLEYGELTEQRLSEALAKHRGITERLAKLRITAGFAGRVVDLEPTLVPGRWVHTQMPLALLVDDRRMVIETFVAEQDVARLRKAGARFYPGDDSLAPFAARVVSIDNASTAALATPWLAADYGGDVPVSTDAEGGLATREAVYRVLLEPAAPVDGLMRMVRGHVRIAAGRRSWLQRTWQLVASVLLRESGF